MIKKLLVGLVLISSIFWVWTFWFQKSHSPIDPKKNELVVLVPNRVSNIQLKRNFDPFLFEIQSLIFETLLRWSSEKGEYRGGLADSWKVDGKKIEFHLREGATWPEGGLVTAKDVLFSLEKELDKDLANPLQGLFSTFVADAEVKDDQTILIRVESPSYYHLKTLGTQLLIFPQSIYDGTQGMDLLGEKWWGSGSYRLEDFVPDQSLKLKSRKQSVPEIKVQFVPSLSERERAIEKNTADWSELSWREAIQLRKSKILTKNLFTKDLKSQAGVLWLLLNHTNPHLAQVKVRQALMYGFDRVGISRKLFNGILKTATGYWPTAHPYSASHLGEDLHYDYNPEKSRQLLKLAGYVDTDGDGILEKEINGQSEELQFEILILDSENGPLVDLFVEQMRTIGVRVN
ncbi:MAG: ABC transporter substrate-binding protein, partial [Bdellovibrionales bacterium]|nr:ABC transporter substrate-binding protein [Bdellovibrionales bacterium]